MTLRGVSLTEMLTGCRKISISTALMKTCRQLKSEKAATLTIGLLTDLLMNSRLSRYQGVKMGGSPTI